VVIAIVFTVYATLKMYVMMMMMTLQSRRGGGVAECRAFATSVGRGLDIGTLASPPPGRPGSTRCDVVPRCPPVLELRQLLQYQPISPQTRQKSVLTV